MSSTHWGYITEYKLCYSDWTDSASWMNTFTDLNCWLSIHVFMYLFFRKLASFRLGMCIRIPQNEHKHITKRVAKFQVHSHFNDNTKTAQKDLKLAQNVWPWDRVGRLFFFYWKEETKTVAVNSVAHFWCTVSVRNTCTLYTESGKLHGISLKYS